MVRSVMPKMKTCSIVAALLLLFSLMGFAQRDTEQSKYWLVDTPIPLVVAATIDEENVFEDTTYTADNFDYNEVTSFGFELWNIIFSRLGVTFKIVSPKGSSKNSLSAVTQMVANGDAMLAIVPTVFVPEETKGLIITQPTHSTRYKLFVQSPQSVSTSLSLGAVFTPLLWLAIIVSMLMMGLILIFIEFVGQKAKIRSYLATPADIGQLIIIIIGCFCYQGAIQIASGCSGRVLVWTSLICGYLIYISYNTLVISQLTTVSFKPPFESLQDMASKGTHKLIVRNQTALLDDIKITRIKDGKRGILADVWDKLLPMKPKAENLYNERKDVARLCKENIAMLDSELEINAQVQQRYKCNAISLRDSYFRSNLGFVLNKNNTFNPVIIRMFNRMRETGIINRMRRYLDQPDVGPLQPLPTLNPIQLDTLIPMLVVLYMGIFGSLVTLGLEIAFSRGGDKLIRRLREKGFNSWRDVVCFWKRKMPATESEEESSDEDEPDLEQATAAPILKVNDAPLVSPIKMKSENEKDGSKYSKKSKGTSKESVRTDAKKIEALLGSQDQIPKPYSKTPVRAPVKSPVKAAPDAEVRPRQRVLRRQDRVADLTQLLPIPLTATLTPVYLDKNVLRDHDSSQGSSNDDASPRSDRNKASPKPTPSPSPEAKSKQSSDGSQKREVRSKNYSLDVPREDFVAVSPKPSPRYDPQDLLRPKPSPRGEEPKRSSPRTVAAEYVNIPRVHSPPIQVVPPPRPPRARQTPAEAAEVQRRRSDPTPYSSDLETTPPSNKSASPKKEKNLDWTPMYYKEQDMPSPARRARPSRRGVGRAAEAPPLYRNLQLSMDSDGFIDGHSILDRNLAQRIRNNRERDPFDGYE